MLRSLYSLLSFVLLLLLSFPVGAQTIDWDQNYGTSGYDAGRSIKPTSDGGFIGVGVSNLTGKIWKLDGSGNVEWDTLYGGTNTDFARTVIETDDGGYLVGISSNSSGSGVPGNNGKKDIILVKLDSNGTLEWDGNYGGPGDDMVSDLIQNSTGNFVIAGRSDSAGVDVSGNNGMFDVWVLEVDGSGNIVWEANYGGSYPEEASSIQAFTGGGYILSADAQSSDGDVSNNYGSSDIWILNIGTSGNLLWEKNLGGSGMDYPGAVRETSGGDLIVAGTSGSSDQDVSNNHGSLDYWMALLNASGTLQWEQNYGGSEEDEAKSVRQTADGGFALFGVSSSENIDVSGNHGSNDYWLMKTDANGAIQWEASFGGSGDDVGHSFEELPSGGFIIDGRSASSDGDVSGNLGSKDYWVVKVDTTSTAIQSYSQNRHIKVHPNPFERSLTLQLPQEWREVDIALFDPQGRKVLERKGLKDDRFNVRADLGSGIYFLRVRTANGEQLRKVVKD